MLIGERLSELRKDKGWTQELLAQKLSLSKYTIQSYEQDKSDPDDETKVKIAKLFDISLDYLLGATDFEATLSRNAVIEVPKDISHDMKTELEKYIHLIADGIKYRKLKK